MFRQSTLASATGGTSSVSNGTHVGYPQITADKDEVKVGQSFHLNQNCES